MKVAARRLTNLVIVASGDCNLRCSYCRIDPTAATPPWGAVRAALDEVAGRRTRLPARVSFTGGEPLLAFPLVRRSVDYLESRRRPTDDLTYRIGTNGLLLREDHVAFLERHRFDVQLSLDGGRAVQDARARSTFEPLVRLLARLSRRHPAFLEQQVTVAMTVTPATVPLLADSVAYLLGQRVARIRIGPAMGVGAAKGSLREFDHQFGRLAGMMREWHDRTGRVPVTDLRRPLGDGTGPSRGGWICDAPTPHKLAIDADGERFPCVMATRAYAGRAPAVMRAHLAALVSVRQGGGPPAATGAASSGEPRHRPAALRLFQRPSGRYSSYGRCADCAWAADCLVCPLAPVMEASWDDPFRVPDFLCAFWRTLLEHRARLPASPPPEFESLAAFIRPVGG